MLWEYRIASFNQKLLLKGSNSVLPEREIREMFYLLVGILKIISISAFYRFLYQLICGTISGAATVLS